MGTREMVVALMLSGAFFVCLIMFAGNMQVLNNVNDSIFENSALVNFSQALNQSSQNQFTNASSSLTSFEEDPPIVNVGGLTFESFTNAMRVIRSSVTTTFNLISNVVFNTIFGGDKQFLIIFNTIGAIFIVLVLVYFWRIFRVGE